MINLYLLFSRFTYFKVEHYKFYVCTSRDIKLHQKPIHNKSNNVCAPKACHADHSACYWYEYVVKFSPKNLSHSIPLARSGVRLSALSHKVILFLFKNWNKLTKSWLTNFVPILQCKLRPFRIWTSCSTN